MAHFVSASAIGGKIQEPNMEKILYDIFILVLLWAEIIKCIMNDANDIMLTFRKFLFLATSPSHLISQLPTSEESYYHFWIIQRCI